jgi:mannose-6-phosphate isomerase-like protein (cupin superfamily)
MLIAKGIAGTIMIAFLVSPGAAQAPTPQRRARANLPATRIIVRNVSGTPLDGVNVTIGGPGNGRATTDAQGVADVTLADGSYRFRFEHHGFITLEREVAIRHTQPVEIDVALNADLTPEAPEPRLPATAPPPVLPAPPSSPSAPVAAAGPPAYVSITAFLDKNFIGREPLKESILGCTPDATTRLLQLRESLASHTHDELDEILYVVAGEGAVRVGDDVTPLTAGSLSMIPRGVGHAIERRGKNPLIVLSTLAGAPCHAAFTAQSGIR